MNRFLSIAFGAALIFVLVASMQPLKAQIYGEYGRVTVLNEVPYTELGTNKVVIDPKIFALPPTFPPDTKAGRDDGYVRVPIGFNFEYNGELYTHVWICVNGFINFVKPGETPTKVAAKTSSWLFNYNTSYPTNVVAPFWGDHFLRTMNDNPNPALNQFMVSEISYATDIDPITMQKVFTVQWKDLNINYVDPYPSAENDLYITSSVGSFQVKFYESTDEYSRQGDIEFCYGQVGGNKKTNDTRIITRNASVGLKGENEEANTMSDFMNGLVYDMAWTDKDDLDYNVDSVRKKTTLTNNWQPSGGTDYRIRFYALGRKQQEEWWGDGDADLSQLEGGNHQGFNQNRFVTPNDARRIIRAICVNVPLDSVRRRNAYHGDANHNGRFFYYYDAVGDSTIRIDLPWKNKYYGDSLGYIVRKLPRVVGTVVTYVDSVVPSGIRSFNEVFYQTTEYDASMILRYIGGRLDSLPWLLEIPQYGKVGVEKEEANNIEIKNIIKLDDNLYKMFVYLNGYNNGPLGIKFNVDGKITDASVSSNDGNEVISDFNDNIFVISGNGNFDNTVPICNITVKSNNKDLNISQIRFNDINKNNIAVKLIGVEENEDNNELLSQNVPNPFYAKTLIPVNIKEEGNYSLSIYDQLGYIVKTIVNDKLIPGTYNYEWNGCDNAGNKLASGIYIYKLTGENISVTKKLVITK